MVGWQRNRPGRRAASWSTPPTGTWRRRLGGSGEYWHPAAQWDDLVTPGYTWGLARAVARRGHVTHHHLGITLTIDDTGTAVLRSGPRVRPATREGWTELSGQILGPPAGLPAADRSEWVDTMVDELRDRLGDAASMGLAGLGYLLLCAIPFVLLFALIGLITRCSG